MVMVVRGVVQRLAVVVSVVGVEGLRQFATASNATEGSEVTCVHAWSCRLVTLFLFSQ